MDDIKRRLNASVAAKLGAAPASAEKDELIEELSDNLYRRFLDMSGAGMGEEAAFNRALEDLGDVDELLSYLGVGPASGLDVTVGPDGSRVAIKGAINSPGDGRPATVNAGGEDAQGQTEAAQGEAQPQGRKDESGGVHYDFDPQGSQGDLDAILANVGEICRVAMGQVKEAAKQAKDAIQRRTTVEKDSGHVRVHFNTTPDGAAPPAPPAPPQGRGWEFEAELDSDEGRFFAGAGPKEKKDVVYGFGYDKAKGGFFAQWGEYKGGGQKAGGPHFCGEGSFMEHKDDGSYSVTALKDLRGVEVYTTSGDVSIHVSEAPDEGVVIGGDVDDLDVTCSADGVLTIREGRTASSSFFSRRGFSSADVELYLPRRHWELISACTASGDVEIDRDGLDVGQLTVKTASGDLRCRLRACGDLRFRSTSGDLELEGGCAGLRADTTSGDISLRGQVEDAALKSASGDIELEGVAVRFTASTMSGDIRVETSAMPSVMELSSKSGDCEAQIPDAGPFSVRMMTTSGEIGCEFPMNYINGMFAYGGGSGPAYSLTTVSGDISLGRY